MMRTIVSRRKSIQSVKPSEYKPYPESILTFLQPCAAIPAAQSLGAGMKIGDTNLQLLHYTIVFNKPSMCGTMPYILFHLPDSNYHFRIDPNLAWMMMNMNRFNGAKKYESWRNGGPPFDVGAVTFDDFHFTCNNPKGHCDFDAEGKLIFSEGEKLKAIAIKARNDYVIRPAQAPAPAPGHAPALVQAVAPAGPLVHALNPDPFASGADFIPVPNHEIPPTTNNPFWLNRQSFSEGKDRD